MSIANYTELQEAVANWLDRDDLTARIPEFIALAEAKIRRKLEWFSEQYSIANGGTFLSASGATTALPTYVRRVRSVWMVAEHKFPLIGLSQDSFRSLVGLNADAAGLPTHYSLQMAASTFMQSSGPKLLLWPRPSSAMEFDLVYDRDITPLATTATNSLLTLNPDLYLYGALAEAEPFLQHDERVMLWKGGFEAALNELQIERERVELGGSNASIALPVVFG